jgi:cytochrome c
MRRLTWLAPAALFTLASCGGGDTASEADMAAANPCAANPCAANPCAANPCAASDLPVDAIRQGDRELNDHGMTWDDLAARGAELWTDKSLSSTGATSCSTCHSGDGTAMMNASFADPYPHRVAMAKDRAGLEMVTAAEMVQLCMAIPMAAEPLDYESVELAALTAKVMDLQKSFDPSKAGEMNPCAANPCAANPCAATGMNPCAANPCGAGR